MVPYFNYKIFKFVYNKLYIYIYIYLFYFILFFSPITYILMSLRLKNNIYD